MSIVQTLAERLAQIVEPLRACVAAHAARHRPVVPLILLLHAYLHRLARRFASLTHRMGATRPVAPAGPRSRHPSAAPPPPRLPQGFAWLARMAPQTNVYGSQLRHLLASAEVKQLLAASPQAASILRPLCRMLGIGPPDADLPPALFAPRRKAAAPVASIQTGPPALEPATRTIMWPPESLAPA